MRFFLAVLMLLAWLDMAIAQVAIGPVAGQPTVVQINPDGATTLRVRWRIQLNSTTGGVATVSSSSGVTNLGATIGGPLTRTVRHPGGGVFFVTITESLYVDRTTAQRIAAAGPGTYNRVFTVGFGGGASAASILTQPSSGGALSLRNVDLSFDDGNRYRVVDPGDPLSARLVVTTNGRGFFSGRWELAGPTGSSAFRPIGRVNKRLSGARRTVFETPNLPTDGSGLYRVRFVPDDVIPGTSRTPLPQLSYSVVGDADARRGVALGLTSPEPGSSVTRTTRFSWRPVKGAARYKLEFSTQGRAGFASDIVAAVASSKTSLRLKPNTLQRLGGRRELFWRVIAFDRAGNPIASSSERRLR
ncbi:MAG: hypothetical protein AAFW87_02060 [Pseudomonadota bacterium]